MNDSRGKLIKNPDAFRRWFGTSKVVDTKGRPKVVYHGTPNQFEAFDPARIAGRNEGAGFYFTTSRKIAAGYGSGGRVIAAYLRLTKPLDYHAKAFPPATMARIIQRAAEIEAKVEKTDWRDGMLSNFVDTYSNSLPTAARIAAGYMANEDLAIEQLGGLVGSGVFAGIVNAALFKVTGHDGFVSRGFSGAGKGGGTIWVAITPQQIKSVDNRGTWDPDDPVMTNPGRRRAWEEEEEEEDEYDDRVFDFDPEVISKDKRTPYEIVRDRLREDGVTIDIVLPIEAMMVLMAQACNFAAKVINYGYYQWKPIIIDQAADTRNVISGWGDDGAFYLFHPDVGSVSFHDPNEEITSGGRWPYGWSGVSRQPYIFDILAGNYDLLATLRDYTTPDALRGDQSTNPGYDASRRPDEDIWASLHPDRREAIRRMIADDGDRPLTFVPCAVIGEEYFPMVAPVQGTKPCEYHGYRTREEAYQMICRNRRRKGWQNVDGFIIRVYFGWRLLKDLPVDLSGCRSNPGRRARKNPGRTVLLYHGSSKRFQSFRSYYRTGEQLGFGIHLTPDRDLALRYATELRKGKGVPTLYTVRAEGLRILDADRIYSEGSPEYALAKKLAPRKPMLFSQGAVYMQAAIDATHGKRAERILLENGYNAVKYACKVSRRGVGGYYAEEDKPSIVVLDPSLLTIVERTSIEHSSRSNPGGSSMSLAEVNRWVPVAAKRGVSSVARSGRGFVAALRKAGSVAKLPEAWKRKRQAFIARHMAQAKRERLWKDGKPSRRALALMMWAYRPGR